MAKHQLHRTFKFVGRRKRYGSGDRLVWESRVHSWLTGYRVEEITCDAAEFYKGML